MRPRWVLRLKLLIASIIVVVLVAPVAGLAQTGSDFVYVFPKFSSDPSAELVLSNLSPRLVTSTISFYDPSGGVSNVYAEIAANGQMRATPTDFATFGAGNFDGTVVVRASGPLSGQAKVPLGNGFKTLEPSVGARNLVIPFSQGTLGSSEISIYNDNDSAVSVVIIAVAENGSAIGSAQVSLAAHGTRRDLLEALIPAVLSSSNRDVSHLLLRVPNNVFGPERHVVALASVRAFADLNEGVRQRFGDTAYVQGVPDTNGTVNATVPLFVNGLGYVTLVQIVNTAQVASTATLTARAPNGTAIGNPVVVALPAGGSARRSTEGLFGLGSGLTLGSINIDSASPTIISAAIGVSAGGFVVTRATNSTSTNFAFAIDPVVPQFFTGFTFLNPGSTPATLTIRDLVDEGAAVARVTQRIEAQSSITRNLTELVPGFKNGGFIHILSDVPIIAEAIYGRTDNTSLTTLSVLHSRSDYIPPDPTKFIITGTVRHNGVALPNASVQLSGPLNVAANTDELGIYSFQNVPNGSYTIRPVLAGYVFNPASIAATVSSDSSRGNDFAALLVVPAITNVQPRAIVANSGATQLLVAGTPITANSEIVFEGRALPTVLTTADVPVNSVDAGGNPTVITQTLTVLKATLDADSVVVPRVTSFFIRTNGPGGSVSSASISLPIGSAAPVLTALSGAPQPLLAGNAGFTATVTGTGFLTGVTMLVSGVPRPTTVVSATQVDVKIAPEDLATGRVLKITAMNPAPTVGASNSLDLSVLNPAPGLLSSDPSSAEVRLEPNAPPITLTVTGFGFKEGAVIKVGSFEIPTKFIRATMLTGDIPQKALTVGGAFPVVVVNPAPSVGTSESLPFLLINLPPVLNSIDPGVLFFDSTRPAENFTAPVIMRGSNFGPNSVFELHPPCTPPAAPSDGTTGTPTTPTTPSGPSPASATLVNSHEAILLAPIACAGQYEVRVRTPQPGGGISQVFTFQVAEFSPAVSPTLLSLSPSSVPARSASFTLTINGSNFQTGAVVSFGSAVLFPTRVTSGSIQVTVPSYLIATPDVIPVVVTNPSSGGSSNRLLFTVE